MTGHVGDGLLTGDDFIAGKEVLAQAFVMSALSSCALGDPVQGARFYPASRSKPFEFI